jgi:hypothetical protein
VLVHIAEDPPTFSYCDTRLRERQRHETVEAATTTLNRTAAGVAGIGPETRVVLGDPADALMEVAPEIP